MVSIFCDMMDNYDAMFTGSESSPSVVMKRKVEDTPNVSSQVDWIEKSDNLLHYIKTLQQRTEKVSSSGEVRVVD